MKTRNSLLLIALAMTLCGCKKCTAPEQGAPTAASQQLSLEERSVDVLQYIEDGCRVYGSLQIWGWSDDNKVAYSHAGSPEGYGAVISRAGIFDFEKNQSLAEISLEEGNFSNQPEAYTDAHKQWEDSLQTLISKYNIKPTKAEFQKLPLKFNATTFDLHLDVTPEAPDYEGVENLTDYVKSFRMWLSYDGTTRDVLTVDDIVARSIIPCGYFVNPYSRQALIVYLQCVRGFEGSDAIIGFVGTDVSGN